MKSYGRRAETQSRAKLGELGHLHTPPLYLTSTSVSLSDLEEISPENGKGGNKACPREVQLLSHAAQCGVQISARRSTLEDFSSLNVALRSQAKMSSSQVKGSAWDKVNNRSFKFYLTLRLLNQGAENRWASCLWSTFQLLTWQNSCLILLRGRTWWPVLQPAGSGWSLDSSFEELPIRPSQPPNLHPSSVLCVLTWSQCKWDQWERRQRRQRWTNMKQNQTVQTHL